VAATRDKVIDMALTYLLALSTQASSSEAIDHAVSLAGEKGAKLVGLFVLDAAVADAVFDNLTDMGFIGDKPGSDLRDAVVKEYATQATLQLESLLLKAKEAGVECESVLRQGAFAETVLEAIGAYAADMLILTRTRRSMLGRLFLGSNIDGLLRKAPCEIKIFEEA